MPPAGLGVNTLGAAFDNKSMRRCGIDSRTVDQGGEVGLMLVSARLRLALVAIGSIVAAALIGGCPWGP
jgi:hypothetical protein